MGFVKVANSRGIFKYSSDNNERLSQEQLDRLFQRLDDRLSTLFLQNCGGAVPERRLQIFDVFFRTHRPERGPWDTKIAQPQFYFSNVRNGSIIFDLTVWVEVFASMRRFLTSYKDLREGISAVFKDLDYLKAYQSGHETDLPGSLTWTEIYLPDLREVERSYVKHIDPNVNKIILLGTDGKKP